MTLDPRESLRALEKQGEDYIWRTARAAGEEIDQLRNRLEVSEAVNRSKTEMLHLFCARLREVNHTLCIHGHIDRDTPLHDAVHLALAEFTEPPKSRQPKVRSVGANATRPKMRAVWTSLLFLFGWIGSAHGYPRTIRWDGVQVGAPGARIQLMNLGNVFIGVPKLDHATERCFVREKVAENIKPRILDTEQNSKMIRLGIDSGYPACDVEIGGNEQVLRFLPGMDVPPPWGEPIVIPGKGSALRVEPFKHIINLGGPKKAYGGRLPAIERDNPNDWATDVSAEKDLSGFDTDIRTDLSLPNPARLMLAFHNPLGLTPQLDGRPSEQDRKRPNYEGGASVDNLAVLVNASTDSAERSERNSSDLYGNTIAVWGVFGFYGLIGLIYWIACRRGSNSGIQDQRQDNRKHRP